MNIIFNRQRKIIQLERAAKKFAGSDFIHVESANRIIEQFDEIIKKRFDKCLNIGARTGFLSNQLLDNKVVKEVFETEATARFFQNNKNKIIADEEFLPFKNESFDLIVSNLSLHWVNDLPGCLIQIKRMLKKGGFFCANFFGGKALSELRHCMILADEKKGETSPRISPFLGVKDGAALLQRTNFDEPVSASEELTVKYNNIFEILTDLRNTGETNALDKLNNKFPGKKYFEEVNDIYMKEFSDEEKNINATIELITISGWKK